MCLHIITYTFTHRHHQMTKTSEMPEGGVYPKPGCVDMVAHVGQDTTEVGFSLLCLWLIASWPCVCEKDKSTRT